MFSAPSGGIPIASDTAHCGQKQIRCAFDFCRGFTPTVCANMYTATDLCPPSISRLQRKQTIGCTGIPLMFLRVRLFTLRDAAADRSEERRVGRECRALQL